MVSNNRELADNNMLKKLIFDDFYILYSNNIVNVKILCSIMTILSL